MIQDRTYPLPSARNLHVRQRVVRTTAQYALHFALGVALVSLLAGLSVALAGQTAALRVQTRALEAQSRQIEWENAELIGFLARGTSVERVDRFAQDRGFTEAPQLVSLPQSSRGQHVRVGNVTDLVIDTAQATDQDAAAQSPVWEDLLQRLRRIGSLVQG